ncbi:MAG: HAMP domain-containing sensor histidine kinase, partial [Chloroflexota bacterium]
MKSQQLAHWLQDHVAMFTIMADDADTSFGIDQTFHVALYESVIDIALNGQTRLIDSVLESAAARAVAMERRLTDLLETPQRLRQQIWDRICLEIDPEPAFAMLSVMDEIFVYVNRVTIQAYEEADRSAQRAKSAEISRLYGETEQKVMEYAAEVARANRELAHLEQAKTDFISIAAHELKTPLTLIQGYVNILSDLSIDEKVFSLIKGIGRGSERMGNIVNDMLDLSAIDANHLRLVIEPVSIKGSIELVIVQSEHALTQRDQRIETSGLDQLPIIEADPGRFHQVCKQVINNAIKYTPDGGVITIRAQLCPTTSDKPELVKLWFQDNGVGVAPEDQEKIFEKFYRAGSSNLHSTGETKFMGAGPGLGLA